MSLNKASIAVALAAFLAVGGIAGQALAAPHDGHDGHWRQQRSYQDCIYQALTQEKKAQYDAIMKEFADKTAPLRDKLAAKYIELRTLGNSPTPDPKAIGKATEELVALRNEFAKERSADGGQGRQGNRHQYISRQGAGVPVERPRPMPRNRDDRHARRSAARSGSSRERITSPPPAVGQSPFPAAKNPDSHPVRGNNNRQSRLHIREPLQL